MAKRIGIPRALLYYKYYPFWKTFLEGLGCEVVTSGQTNQKILQSGIRHSIDESCLPVKVFCGHVLDLIEKGVDYLFIPRIESVEKRYFVCTKFLGLPDIVRNCVPLTSLMSRAILSPNIDFNRRFLYQSMFSVGWKLTKNPFKIHTAFWQAKKKQRNFEEMLKFTTSPQEVIELIETGPVTNLPKNAIAKKIRICNGAGQIKRVKSKWDLNPALSTPSVARSRKGGVNIALIAHSYNVYDSFINLGIIKELQRLGVNVITQEMVSCQESYEAASGALGDLYWTYGKDILEASLYFSKKRVDGIIFIISFPCGPDSLTIDYTIRQVKDRVPILSIVIDEHQDSGMIITRLESFIDLVRMRSRK